MVNSWGGKGTGEKEVDRSGSGQTLRKKRRVEHDPGFGPGKRRFPLSRKGKRGGGAGICRQTVSLIWAPQSEESWSSHRMTDVQWGAMCTYLELDE